MSKRLVPLAAARLRHETNLRIALLAKVEKLAAELREHLDVAWRDDPKRLNLDEAFEEMLSLVESAPFKSEPEKPADG